MKHAERPSQPTSYASILCILCKEHIKSSGHRLWQYQISNS